MAMRYLQTIGVLIVLLALHTCHFLSCSEDDGEEIKTICCECTCQYVQDIGVPPEDKKGSGPYSDCELGCIDICNQLTGGSWSPQDYNKLDLEECFE